MVIKPGEQQMHLLKTKQKKLFIIIGGLIAALIIAFQYIINNLNIIGTDNAYIEGKVYNITPKISGTVSAIYIEDNRKVKKNDLLIEIDPIDYELQVFNAQAVLNKHKILFDQASRTKDRAIALDQKEVLSKDKYELAITAYNAEKFQVESAESQFKIAQRNLENTKIYAPSDGYVTKKSIEIGEQIRPGQALVAIISSDMWIVANYKETQLKKVRIGQPVKIKIDTYADQVFTGRVDSLQRSTGAKFSMFPPENASGNFVKVVQRIPVKIVFDEQYNIKHDFGIGMSAITEINVR